MRGVSVWRSDSSGGSRVVDVDRPRLEPEVADRVVDYLHSGTVLVYVFDADDDVLEPGAGWVGKSISTDGLHVWDESLAYYVQTYRLDPGADFVEFLVARDFLPRQPSADELAAASALVGVPPPGTSTPFEPVESDGQ